MAFEENVSNPDPMWRILLLDSRLVGSSKRVPDVCFLRQRKPTSSPKNMEKNLLNSYNLTPCNRFSHLRTEVEYVVKNYSTAHERLLDGGFADGMLLLQTASIRPGSWQFENWKLTSRRFPCQDLEKFGGSPVSDLHCPNWQLCTQSIDTARCEKPRRSHRQSSASWLLPALHRCIHSHHPN